MVERVIIIRKEATYFPDVLLRLSCMTSPRTGSESLTDVEQHVVYMGLKLYR